VKCIYRILAVKACFCWTKHCPSQLEQYIPEDKEVKFMTIPKKTTSFIQPFLDVFGFRIWKNFIRTSDNVILQEKDINLHSRNDIIKLQSLTHNQFFPPRFKNLFQYAWFKNGYLITHPGEFPNPVFFCYFKNEKYVPKCSICERAFMHGGDYFLFSTFLWRITVLITIHNLENFYSFVVSHNVQLNYKICTKKRLYY